MSALYNVVVKESIPWPHWISPNGECLLINADCLSVLPTLGPVDAVVTSPPYNQLGSRLPAKASGMHAESQWVSNTKAVGYADDMPEDEYQSWLLEVMAQCASVCVDGGSIFINHKCRWRDTVLLHPVDWIKIRGARLRQEIIWMRAGSTTLNARMFAPSEERILWWISGTGKWKWNQEAASFLSVWDISQDNLPDGHPCPFPVEIPRRCITGTTDMGDTVLDPFMGSGTTGVACSRLGRHFIGIEIEPRYFNIACERIRREYDQLKLFPPEEKRDTVQMELIGG